MANKLDIAGLLSAAKAGDETAKAQLLGCFRDYLRLLANLQVRPLIQSKFDESDLVQEACIQAIAGFEQFEGNTEIQFAAWLRQILANKGAAMARAYQTEKRDVRLERQLHKNLDQSSIDLGSMIPDHSSSPSGIVIGRERSVILAEAISQLKGEQRDVLIMHGLQRLSVREIAKSLGRSEASTWKLWARGLQALQSIAKRKL